MEQVCRITQLSGAKLPADLLGEELIRRVVDVWLNTDYEGGRHERRLKMIADYEKNGKAE